MTTEAVALSPNTFTPLAFSAPLRLTFLARKTRDKRDLLLRADARLEQVRLYLRLAHDLKLLNLRQYEYAGRLVAEIGALLGDWMQRVGAQPRGGNDEPR